VLSGKRYAITGANTGVGRATAVALAERGADVVLLCRSTERAGAVAEEIESVDGAGDCTTIEMDLASLASVRSVADALARDARGFDGLINNAGVGGARGVTADGFEVAFGVNYLGHYLLTRALLDRAVRVARVVHVGSGSHEKVRRIDFHRFEGPTRSLTGIAEYAVSKLCVMLFHHELARRLLADDAVSLAADPGDVASDAWRHIPALVRPFIVCGMKSPAEGARTSVFCATDPGLTGANGHTFVDEAPCNVSALSKDRALAKRLWDRSADFVEMSP